MNEAEPVRTVKDRLRRMVREKLREVTIGERLAGNDGLARLLGNLDPFCRARFIGGFIPMGDEPDIEQVLRDRMAGGARVAVPAFNPGTGGYGFRELTDWEADLVPGRYGVREPKASCGEVDVRWLDFVLVPGIAFDPFGGRLGRGKGFYDRLLSRAAGTTCGVGLAVQLVESVPMEPHDRRLDLVAVPGRLLGPKAMGTRC